MKRFLSVLLSFVCLICVSGLFGTLVQADFLAITEQQSPFSPLSSGLTIYHKAYCQGTYYLVFDAQTGSPAGTTALDATLYDISDKTTLSTGSVNYEPFADIYRSFFLSSDTRFAPQMINKTLGGDFANLPANQNFLSIRAARGTQAGSQRHTGTYRFAGLTFTNLPLVASSQLAFWTDTDPIQLNKSHSTSIATSAGSSLAAGYDYVITTQYIPEPCLPDTQGPLVRDQSLSDSLYHAPGKNTDNQIGQRSTSIMSDFRFDIIEPSGQPTTHTRQTSPGGRTLGSSSDIANYIPQSGLTNQRGVDPESVIIALRYIAAPISSIDQSSYTTYETVLLSGSDLAFSPLAGLSDSRNKNKLGYRVSLSPTKKQALRDAGMDFRKESTVDMGRYATDFAGSMRDTVQRDRNNILPVNPLEGANGYTFLNNGQDPSISLFRDTQKINQILPSSLGLFSQNTRTTNTSRQVLTSHTGVAFELRDEWAGVNPDSIVVTAKVYQSAQRLHQTYRTNTSTTGRSSDSSVFSFSGADLLLASLSGVADTPDQSGFLDFSLLSPYIQTGSRVVLSFSAQDYVGKLLPQAILTLDAPDWPPAPPVRTYHLGDYENGQTVTLQSLTGVFSDYPYLSGLTYNNQQSGLFSDTVGGPVGPNIIADLAFAQNQAGGTYAASVSDSTLFSFDLVAHNIYGIQTPFTVTVRISPTCADASGNCGSATFIYTGETLSGAHQNFTSGSGTWFKKNWFALVRGSDTQPLLYQDPTYPDAVVLQCFSGSAIKDLSLRPYDSSSVSSAVSVTGTTSFTGNKYYLSGNILYVIRPLTGNIQYFPPELDSDSMINRTQGPVTGFVTLGTGTTLVSHPFVTSGGVGNMGNTGNTFSTTQNTGHTLTLTNMIGQTQPLPLDIYRIDRTPPSVSFSQIIVGSGARNVSFVGSNTGDLTYTSDDAREFVTRSGVGLVPDYATGLSLNHNVLFTTSRSGSILIQDKAGNQNRLAISISAGSGSTYPFEIVSYAEQRGANNYALSGTLRLYEKNFSDRLLVQQTDLALNSSGRATTDLVALTGEVLVTREGEAHLIQALTGNFADFSAVSGTGNIGLIDFTTLSTRPALTVFGGIIYATAGDVEKQSSNNFINALDVHLFNINAGGSDLRFDFNKNGSVNATDMAILIGNLNKGGWGW